ncbi:substrate-binding domain-containing protein [Oleiharenicola lentus]|uniref:substrate-binding domain-containing protein n=1 Tax=Oleiharenicola lentus TaxID=2508720 RepID=UPI003F675B48
MTSSLGNFSTLPHQVAAALRAEIDRGAWPEWLPGERPLTESLRVSRKTLRKALAQLQHEGVIVAKQGLGHRVVTPSARPKMPAANVSVGLLTPESIENLRPYTALWVDELRALLFESGIRLAIFSGHRFFNAKPESALRQLVRQNLQSAWVLAHTNHPIQRWFHEQRIPSVIAGSCHLGQEIPSVDKDNFACCRHAAGALLRAGHTRLAYLTRQSQRAGDIESESGFIDGVKRSTNHVPDPIIARHDGTVAGVNRALARLFKSAVPPTGILVANPVYYLSAITFLAQRGLRVPQDISLVSRDDDSFLGYLSPEPARYTLNAKVHAKRIFTPLKSLLRGEPVANPVHRIEPTFISGASIASPGGNALRGAL